MKSYLFLFLAHVIAKRIIDDIEQKRLTNLHDAKSGSQGLIDLANSRQIRFVSYNDWKRLDAYETNLGLSKGKPREKILDVHKMIELSSPTTTTKP